MRPRIRINFTDFWHENTATAIQGNPIFRLLSKRFDLELCDSPDFLIYSCFGVEYSRYDCTRIFFTGENKRPRFWQCDYAFGYDYPDNDRNFRLPLYAFYDTTPLTIPKDADALLAGKSGFCAFVFSNFAARERMRFLDLLSKYKRVDCGGLIRNNVGYRVANKVEFMRSYKFSIAFENSFWPGYTTEKLPEALAAGTVPLYWGNPWVERDFNPASFVNAHKFRAFEEMVDFVVALDKNDALYKQYLAAPGFENLQPNRFIDENRILDRFSEIFAAPPKRKVAHTWRAGIERAIFAPRRWRERRRAGRRLAPTRTAP